MKIKLIKYLFTLLCLFAVWGCSDEETVQPEIVFHEQESTLVLGAEANAKQTLSMTSTYSWKASANCNWIVLSPNFGDAGEATIAILAREDNKTGEARNAVITVTSEGISKDIAVQQLSMDVLNVSPAAFNLSSQEQKIEIEFSTNIADCDIVIANTSSSDISWIQTGNQFTRVLQEGKITLNISENKEPKERKASFVLQGISPTTGEALIESATVTVVQEAAPVGTSTDYSCDKQIIELQRHSEGNGIPLIFMGDGFLDKDIKSGYYQQVMEKAMENFFTEEPIRSLRDYFDVWAVTAVSANNAFGSQYTTRFGCRLAGGGSTLIEGNHETVMEYAEIIPVFQTNPNLFNEATCIVILNTEDYAGTCYFGFNDGKNYINLAIGYCPMIYGMEDDMFRRVLCHECIGHGFTKLLDEYSYQEMGRMPDNEIADARNQQAMGWAANVDFTSDRNAVLWSKFLQDSRYQSPDNYGETLGVYTGACTYWSGAYRPTNESMMRSNMHGFNVPSREAIYKRIMSTAYGSVWAYDYETFVAFDQAHLPTPSEAYTRATYEEATRPFATPVFTNMTVLR